MNMPNISGSEADAGHQMPVNTMSNPVLDSSRVNISALEKMMSLQGLSPMRENKIGFIPAVAAERATNSMDLR